MISDNSTSFTFSSFINFSWNIINIGDFNIIILLISNLVQNLVGNFELDVEKKLLPIVRVEWRKVTRDAVRYFLASEKNKVGYTGSRMEILLPVGGS